MSYLLFASILLTFVASHLAIQRAGITPALTVSQHVAKSRTSIIIFRIMFALAALFFAAWSYFWLFQNVSLGLVGKIAFVCIVLCFLAAAIFPYIENTSSGAIHNFFAWGLVYVFPLAIGAIVATNPETAVRNVGVTALLLLIILLLGYIFVRSQRKYFLFYQMAFVTVFFGYMVILTLFA